MKEIETMTRASLEQALAALTYKGTSSWAKERPAIEAIRAELAKLEPTQPVQPECWCTRCDLEVNTFRSHMAICPLCGDKRCPRAKDHRDDCAKKSTYDQTRPIDTTDIAIEAIRAELAKPDASQPAWQDTPNAPGFWLCDRNLCAYTYPDDWEPVDSRVRSISRWFGPINKDTK